MNAWRPSRAAWAWEAGDILVVPVDRPLQQPLRLTGTAVDCWVALIEADEAMSSRMLARALLPSMMTADAASADVDSMVTDIENFFSALSESGLVIEE